jgi:serine/threonine-protein kinase
MPLRVKGPKDPLLGVMVKGAYRLDKKLAAGGMGAIYRATEVSTGRWVAVKLLLPGSEHLDEHVRRFTREAQTLERLRHRNVVELLDHGCTPTGTLFIVMEYLTGKTVEDVVPEDRGIPVDAIVEIMEQACAGVGAAHKQRLVHRDLKPANIYLAQQPDKTALVKVIDFGLAKPMVDRETQLTSVGKVVGSAGFIAPEHILGSRDFQESSDIYGLGAVLYFMLTGRKPYDGNDIVSVMTAQVHEKPPPLNLSPSMNDAFAPVVSRAMARKPEKRFRTTEDLLAEVHAALEYLDEDDTIITGEKAVPTD